MIKILDKHVADKIAAGEVIDRPVSIIKELLENSLDAGADHITIEIRKGGKDYIRITDNGCGIAAGEAELAFARHATSKITSAEDLDSIETLGFRGEALASICAVARVELITKTISSKTGRHLILEGSKLLENTATGCPDGTTVTVRDLFYNVPARKKFLASDSAETRRIVDMVSRIALSYGDVKFNLINGSSKVFSTRGNGNILNNIISIYGSDTGRELLPVESSRGGFLLKGFISPPAVSAPSRSRQIFCVNGRVISSDVLEKALDAAYREKLFHGRFPLAFLFLAMPPDKLDVNVHPTKKEVRFDDPFEVSDFVADAVRAALSIKGSLPQIRHEHIKPLQHTGRGQKEAQAGKKLQDMRETQTVQEVKAMQEMQEVQYAFASAKELQRDVAVAEEVDVKNILSSMRQEQITQDARQMQNLLEPEKPETAPFDFGALRFKGTIFNTYIMAADEDSFYLIDQHAAHERVFYERLLAQYNNAEKVRQPLLMPLQFNVAAQVTATEEAWHAQVCSMGYEIEFFGNNTYLVREIPAFMELEEAETFLADFFRSLEDKPDLTNQKTLERIITRSCKSAVKGGDALSDSEIDALIKDLGSCVNPFSCPHGRPTFIRMRKYEIEKLFKRV